ncbi:MAG: hemolysin family protein [Actinomycetota bacterium]|nr:hemolysin family protein [Actinomycetota bacterium]
MEGLVFSGLKVLAALLLVVLNGLFVAAEFSFTRLRSTSVESMVRDGKVSAGLVREATRNLDTYLAVCQVGITIASLGLGALGEPAVAALINPLLASFLPEGAVHAVAFALSFLIITFLHVVFGELASKSFAIAKPEGTSQFVAPFMKFFYYVFLPAIWVFNGTANAFVRAFGIPSASEVEETHSEEELHMIVRQSKQQGFLEADEEARLQAVFELDEKTAREIMVPRPDVVALPADTPLRELVSIVAAGRHTRYPIHEDGSSNRVIGTVHLRDVLRAVESESGIDAGIKARDLTRDVLVVPENKLVDDVLEDLQEKEMPMAVVVDEWGAFEGLITSEDIFEEIVGEIRDEFDEEKPAVRELDDGGYVVEGSAPIRTVNEALGCDLASEDFETLGGVILGTLGHAPEVGDEITLDGHVFRVEEVDGARVARITARRERG